MLPDTLHAEFRSSVSHGSIKFNSVALCVCTNAGRVKAHDPSRGGGLRCTRDFLYRASRPSPVP